jgi:hypothetical protein
MDASGSRTEGTIGGGRQGRQSRDHTASQPRRPCSTTKGDCQQGNVNLKNKYTFIKAQCMEMKPFLSL